MSEHPHEKHPPRRDPYDPVGYIHEQFERLSAFELAPGLFIGQEFTVPDIESAASFGGGPKLPWVAIERGGTGHGPSESGVVQEGAQVKALGLSKSYGVLCEYHPATRARGTEVSEGSLFFLPVAVLKGWPLKIERDALENQRRSRTIDGLLATYEKAVAEMGVLGELREPKPEEVDDQPWSASRDRSDDARWPQSGHGDSHYR